MSTTVLATKLHIPPPRPRTVRRPRLIDRLNDGLASDHRLTLISAPAGFGKTSLVSEWLAASDRPACWLSLDERDNDSARFLSYLIAAARTVAPNLGAGLDVALQSPQPPPTESILTSLLNEISAIPTHFTLVLDDYHAIDSGPIDQAIAFLIDNLPSQVHLVIATREDPYLPLARLRVRGQLTELRAADLRFTPTEAAGFLNEVMGLNLSTEDVAALETRTEGWIAGLQLAALALQGMDSTTGRQDTDGFIKSFTGSHHFVLDYLVEEVLQQQPSAVQTFLLRTSILDRMCGPLCDAVLLDPATAGKSTLAYLERANMFIVPLDNERLWYRYHHLFGDFLRKRLGQSLGAEGIAELHIHASEWFEANDLAFEAFRHATAAGDVDRAERLIESRKIRLYLRSEGIPVLDWLTSLPPAVLDAHPLLWVRSATLALMSGQNSGVEERLQAAEKALKDIEPDARTRDLFGQIACARATLAVTRYDPATMLVQARRALEYLRPDNLTFQFTANWALATALMTQGDRVGAAQASQVCIAISQKSGYAFSQILAATNLGRLQELNNQLHQAAESYQRMLQLVGDHPQPNASEAHIGLARIFYEWNDLEAADRHGQQSLQLSRLFDRTIDRFIFSEVFLARLKMARGDLDGAAASLAEAERSALENKFPRRLPGIADVQVSVLIRQGRAAAAAELARQYDLPLCLARALIADGNPSAALAALEASRQQAEDKGWADERLKVMVLRAVALHALGDKDEAVQLLGEALALAEPGGFIRMFVDEGPPMARLLSEAVARGVRPDCAARLLAVFEAGKPKSEGKSQPAVPPAQPLIEPLSQRELEILRLIAEGLSNREICDRLFLALDTVKGHNRRIFDKLQVRRRTEAIARARELNLL